MTPTTPTPGEPLNGESVRLLMPGDVISHPEWGVTTYRPATDDPSPPVGPWSFVSRPTAQADKTAPEDPNISASNAELLEQALSHPPLSMPAPARKASDASAEGVGELHARATSLANSLERVGTTPDAVDMIRTLRDSLAALTQAAPADPVAGVGEVAKRLSRLNEFHRSDCRYNHWSAEVRDKGCDCGLTRAILASLSPSPGVTDNVVEALTLAIPSGVCLTNRNVPDSQIVCLDATMGDLRKMAQALAAARQTEEGA